MIAILLPWDRQRAELEPPSSHPDGTVYLVFRVLGFRI